MKKLPLLFLAIFLTLSAYAQTSQGTLGDTHKSPEAILQEVKTGKAYLVDVRTPEEYGEGHLAHSKNIDFRAADFKSQISKLDRSKPVYLYCRSGNRSGKAADTLQTLNFKAAYNIGGFVDLKAAGLPAEP
ncbi:rhodanese-like domain-containing protein [Spirosoma sp.]|uniref:rhodanese-like domain-containing protein n=1 Tax=Spirosoma sp. TaxID=1899569 RepID=UPI003B3AEBA7